MSTRSNIIVADQRQRVQLYRHHDGYPQGQNGVLATVAEALPYAWPLPSFEAGDFAAALVRAWKGAGGGSIFIDGTPEAWELVHGDTEWVYVITPTTQHAGEPVVAVYDWHRYLFDHADLDQVPPKPVVQVPLSQAHKAGLTWEK